MLNESVGTNELGTRRREPTAEPSTPSACASGVVSTSTGGPTLPLSPTLTPEREKLLLEGRKLLWEQEKLQAETEEIQKRNKKPAQVGKWATFGKWVGDAVKYAAIVVPLVIAAIAASSQWKDARDQRERLARFTVGKEVTELAARLNDTSDEAGQRLAAYELAWFGRPAIFLLFQQLVEQDLGDVRDATISALAEIARTEKGVMELLAQTTQAYVGATLDTEHPDITGITNRLTALANVAAAIESVDIVFSSEYRATIAAIEFKLQAQPAARLPGSVKAALLAIVQQRLLVSH